MTVDGTQLSPSASTDSRDTVVRQVQWSAAVQTPVNYHCQLEEHPIGDVKPVKLVVQYLTQAAVKRSSASDDARSRVQRMLYSWSVTVLAAPHILNRMYNERPRRRELILATKGDDRQKLSHENDIY